MRIGWFALAGFLSAGALVYRGFSSHRGFTQALVTPAAETTTAQVRPALEHRPTRPVYPYSVIRGGVYSEAEFDAALRQDSVASAHYADFHRESLRIVKARERMPMYASYRMDNAVYWTSHPVHIAAGEALITDGTSVARARCGNRLSLSPREPVTRLEPMEREMDTPESPDFAEPSGVSPRTLHTLLNPHPPAPPGSALAFEIFPPALLSAVPESTGISGTSPNQAAQLPTTASEAPPGPIYTLPPSPFYPAPPNEALPVGAPVNLQEAFPYSPPAATVLKVSQVTPPVFPGVITVIERFPGAVPQEGGTAVTGAFSGQSATTTQPPGQAITTTQPPAQAGGPRPGESAPPNESPGTLVAGGNAVPEPIAGGLVCFGLVLLSIVARRRGTVAS